MKRICLFILSVAICGIAVAQKQNLKVETHYLSNGLKVIMVEEHSQPKIYGAVMVHAGSKNEDTAATGVAHYFEHIMFKGTDRIGTTDWEKENPILDSISDLYDQIQATHDAELRHELQLEINRLNIEASKYAIPNETDAILQQMGCTGLNAFTSFDVTCYHNTLPSNQLENWMEVYAERFRNPVYRLFQGELEAVYEERNIYANELMYTFQRNIFTEAFGEHPYSRDVIGHDWHLKNPQPSAMKKFYDKYYVASNMALILVGDFNSNEALEMAEKYFSIWPRGEKVEEPTYKLPKFDSRIVKEVKQTPVKVGLMLFPAVKHNDPDELLLEIACAILSGGNGRLDELATKGKLMAAQLLSMTLSDAGVNAMIYVPKLIGQKHEEAENLIWAEIDSIKQGRFSEELLESIKMSRLISRQRQLESYSSIANLIQSLEMNESNYEEWLKEGERLQKITREDIMAVVNKYYDQDHCTIIRSKMGFPKKGGSIKPDWDHLEAQNTGEKTEFAKHIASREIKEIEPQTLDYKSLVETVPVSENCTLYASKNPKNNLFSLNINYHYGSFDNHNIEEAMNYFSSIGAGGANCTVDGRNVDMTPEQFRIEMGCLGGSFSLSSGNDYSHFSISGPEENMEKILELAMLKLRNPRHDQQQLENLVEALQASKREAKNDADIWSNALFEYVMYGDSSEYINHATIKEIKKMKGEDLVALIDNLFGRDGYVTYVGNKDPQEVAELLKKHELVREEVTVMPKRVRQRRDFDKGAVFYATNKKFLKSDIDMYIPSEKFNYEEDRADCLMFNEYMSGSMAGIFFQEIREMRSLAYSTYGRFRYDRFNRTPSYYLGYVSTQCDKTNDAIEAVRDLMLNFPERPEKFDNSKDYLISVRNSNYITFRSLPGTYRYLVEEEKTDKDNRSEITDEVNRMSFEDLKDFHKRYVEGRPLVIVISGNAKKFDLENLGKYGKIQEVKFKDMIKF